MLLKAERLAEVLVDGDVCDFHPFMICLIDFLFLVSGKFVDDFSSCNLARRVCIHVSNYITHTQVCKCARVCLRVFVHCTDSSKTMFLFKRQMIRLINRQKEIKIPDLSHSRSEVRSG